EVRPRVIQIVLRRLRRMIGMRMVEADEVRSGAARLRFALPVVLGAHEEPAPRPFMSHVDERPDVHDVHDGVLLGADHRAAAFVRVGRRRMTADRVDHLRAQANTHASLQNGSDRYLAPPSGKIVTTTESGCLAAMRPATSAAAPLETPASSPWSRA